jgi:hypothetical protein
VINVSGTLKPNFAMSCAWYGFELFEPRESDQFTM